MATPSVSLAPRLFPNVRVETQLLPADQLTPVEEEKGTNDQEAHCGGDDAFRRKGAVKEISQTGKRGAAGEDHHGVADELSHEEGRQDLDWIDLREAGGGKQRGGRERGQRVDEHEGPA